MGFAPTRPRRTPVSETGAYTSSATRRKKLVRTRGFAPPRARAHELLRLVRILSSATSGCWSASRDLHPHALCRAAGFKPAVFPGFTRGRRNGQVAGNCTRFPGVTSRCPATWAAHLSVKKWSAARESHPHEHRCPRRFELRVSPIAPAAERVRVRYRCRGLTVSSDAARGLA